MAQAKLDASAHEPMPEAAPCERMRRLTEDSSDNNLMAEEQSATPSAWHAAVAPHMPCSGAWQSSTARNLPIWHPVQREVARTSSAWLCFAPAPG